MMSHFDRASVKWSRFVVALAGLLAPLLWGDRAAAHPHIWVNVHSEVLFDETGAITGLRQKWTFDEMFSGLALQGTDTNGDGEYSKDELKPLAGQTVSNISEFDYFTFAKLGDTQVERKAPTEYAVSYDGALLSLAFTLPFAETIPADRADRFSFSVYDPTFFISFSLAQNEPVKLASGAPPECALEIADAPAAETTTQTLSEAFFENLDPARGWGGQFAQDVSLRCTPAS